jgi:hypothetical protein
MPAEGVVTGWLIHHGECFVVGGGPHAIYRAGKAFCASPLAPTDAGEYKTLLTIAIRGPRADRRIFRLRVPKRNVDRQKSA